MKNRYFVLFVTASLILACGKNNDIKPDPEKPDPEEFEIPEAPETIVSTNTFAVEYFCELPSPSETSKHILEGRGKRPLIYVFGNVTYTPGKQNDLIETAINAKSYPFFLQRGATSIATTPGIGFLTRYVISGFDGECEGTPFGGPTILSSLSTVLNITLYNVNCPSKEMLTAVVESKQSSMYADAVVYGYCDVDPKVMKEYCESKALSMRFDYTTLGGKTFYTLLQPGYVNRGFETLSLDGIEYVRILFEKLY